MICRRSCLTQRVAKPFQLYDVLHNRKCVVRSWICTPTDSMEFTSHQLDNLMKEITFDNCDKMNHIISMAHNIDDMYTSKIESIMMTLVFICILLCFGLINTKQ